MRILMVCLMLLAGCQDRFRYPCMDPANWQDERCKRPQCAITQECPDQLLKPEDMKKEPTDERR